MGIIQTDRREASMPVRSATTAQMRAATRTAAGEIQPAERTPDPPENQVRWPAVRRSTSIS